MLLLLLLLLTRSGVEDFRRNRWSAWIWIWSVTRRGQVLFEPKQWDSLVELFKQEFCKLYGMTLEPLLSIYLQAGLTALKTPYPWSASFWSAAAAAAPFDFDSRGEFPSFWRPWPLGGERFPLDAAKVLLRREVHQRGPAVAGELPQIGDASALV